MVLPPQETPETPTMSFLIGEFLRIEAASGRVGSSIGYGGGGVWELVGEFSLWPYGHQSVIYHNG